MIAINWFEVFLPSETLNVPFEEVLDGGNIPAKQKSLTHRTIFYNELGRMYHLCLQQPPNTNSEPVVIEHHPSIGTYAIEHGFAKHLQDRGFEVQLRHVGGAAHRLSDKSLFPNIYQSLDGLEFRCFKGFITDSHSRWGLILSFSTRQRFLVSLADEQLARLAHGKRVIPLRVQHDEEQDLHPGIFHLHGRGSGAVIDRDGAEQTIQLDEWTLPCRKDNLLNYLKLIRGAPEANRVSTRLQQDTLAITPEGRMNTNLAKDQLNILQQILESGNLYDFQLLSPDHPNVRMSKKPLIV